MVETTVNFSEAVDITGTPQLELDFAGTPKAVDCVADTNTNTNWMGCYYQVVAGDVAAGGVAIAANKLTLNGGAITATGSTTNNADLDHSAVAIQANHKVDGIRPTLVTSGADAPTTSTDGTQVILTFSETIGTVMRTDITIRLTVGSTTVTASTTAANADGTKVVLDLNSTITSSIPTLTVALAADAVEDTAGNGNIVIAATSITNNVPSVLDAPTTLTATPAPTTTPQVAITLIWTASASDGGSAITKHQYRQKTGSDAFGAWTDIPNSAAGEGNETDYTVKGLTANNPPTTFTFEVQAVNANGDSGPSNQAAATVDVPDTTFPTLTEGNQQITVQWPTPDNNGSAILRYQIQQAQTVAGSTTHTEWTNIQNSGPGKTNASSYTVTGLTNGIPYAFGIRAVNSVGTGIDSYSGTAIPRTIPGAPTGLTAEPGDGQVRLQWTAPISDGGNPINSYEYQQKTSSTPFGSWINISGSNANTTEHTVTGLTNGTNYTFRVRAKNPMGEGLPSNEASATPVTVPSVPQNFTLTPGNGRVRLDWTAPASDGGSAILRYEHRHKAGTDSFTTWTNVPGSNINTTQYTVTGLTNGTLYTFEIRAATATTRGMAASETTTPMAVAPDAPRELSTRSQNQAIELTWQPPLDNGGSPIIRYEYQQRTGNGPFGTWMNIPNSGVTGLNANSYTVTGLTNGASYHFKLRAVNNADESAASNEALGIPQPITTPDKPRAMQVSSGNGRVIVQWIEPLRDGGTPILHYEYCLQQLFQCASNWITIPDSAPGETNHGQYAISSSNGTFTRVHLRAVNDQGRSNSVDRSAVPLAGAPAAPANLRGEAISAEHVKLSWREPAAPWGITITGYSLERSRDGTTWVYDFYRRSDSQKYLGHSHQPPGTTSLTVQVGENATLYYRIRTLFRTNTPTIGHGADLSQGFSPTSPIIQATTVGAEGILVLPPLGVSDGYGLEGPNAAIIFDVTLLQPRTSTVRIFYRTRDITARAGSDYTPKNGFLVFTPGETEKTVSVLIIDDTVEDSGEQFALLLSNISGAHLARSSAFGTINNTEDIITGFTLVNSATETDVGPIVHDSTVQLTDPANGEYGIRVDTVPDTGINSIRIQLFGPKNVTRTDNEAPYTLYAQDREGLPPGTYTLQATAYPETDRGGDALESISISFTVTEAPEETDPASLSASFPTSPFASKSHSGSDDRPQVIVTFSQAVESFNKNTPSVQVTSGTIASFQAHTEDGLENAYVFFLTPDGDGDVTITFVADQICDSGGICTADGTLLTNLPPALSIPGPEVSTPPNQLSVSDAEASEENDSTIDFVVKLNPARSESVSVNYATANGTATAGEDYTATSGTLTFAGGETSKTVSVPITDDTIDDDNETLTLTLSNASGADIADAQATGTIRNSETPAILLTASFANMPADHNGGNFTFDLTFSENVDAGYARIRDDAFTISGATIASARRKTQGSNQGWTVEVDPTGNGSVTITLPETTDCNATGAICTDDSRKLSHSTSTTVAGPPAISVSDATVQEAEGAILVFTASLSHASSRTVTVDYATSDGTAQAGSDYTAASATLTFNAGETSQTVQVTVLTDQEDESDETLTLTLSNPSQATLGDGAGTGTIENGESSSGTQEDPPAETPAVLLTASFDNMPATHNGSAFTFDLSFSENVRAGYERIRDDAFAITGGDILKAQRKAQGSNQGWTITVKPDGNGAVYITLPETTDCNATGAICTDDERKLSHTNVAAITGPG